jgi:hypothetical protein
MNMVRQTSVCAGTTLEQDHKIEDKSDFRTHTWISLRQIQLGEDLTQILQSGA